MRWTLPGGRRPGRPTLRRSIVPAKFPALVLDNGFALREVLPICEYLEEVFPERPLIGAGPEERAEARMWTRYIDLKYCETMSQACIVAEGEIRKHYLRTNRLLPASVAPELTAIANDRLRWIDGELVGRQFVCGDRFTLADVHFFCFLDFFEVIGFPYPRDLVWLDEYCQRIKTRPSALG
jgi:glutathione S-transferase